MTTVLHPVSTRLFGNDRGGSRFKTLGFKGDIHERNIRRGAALFVWRAFWPSTALPSIRRTIKRLGRPFTRKLYLPLKPSTRPTGRGTPIPAIHCRVAVRTSATCAIV